MIWPVLNWFIHIVFFILMGILWWHVQRLAPWCHFRKNKVPVAQVFDDSFYILPYALNALEPVIDTKTVDVHYTKHHRGYYEKAMALCKEHNLSLENLEVLLKDTHVIPEGIRQALINQGGGYLNHNFYWDGLTPYNQKSAPSGELLNAIERTFGSLDAFKDVCLQAALKHMGSGWVWLVVDKDGQLKVITTANQDSPLTLGYKPLLALDIWEHAYYLKYQNRRSDHIKALWDVVNWDKVAERYRAAK